MKNKMKVQERLQFLYQDAMEQINRLDEGVEAWDVNDVDNWQSIADNVELIANMVGVKLKDYSIPGGER